LDFVPDRIAAPTDSRVHFRDHFPDQPSSIVREIHLSHFASVRELKTEESASRLAADAAGSINAHFAVDNFLGKIPNQAVDRIAWLPDFCLCRCLPCFSFTPIFPTGIMSVAHRFGFLVEFF
jgi:hypothetical protein